VRVLELLLVHVLELLLALALEPLPATLASLAPINSSPQLVACSATTMDLSAPRARSTLSRAPARRRCAPPLLPALLTLLLLALLALHLLLPAPSPSDTETHEAPFPALLAHLLRATTSPTPAPSVRDPFRGESSRPSCVPGAQRFNKSLVAVLVPASATQELRHEYATWYPYAESRAFFVGGCPACNYSLSEQDETSGLSLKVRAMFVDALARFPHVKFFVKMDADTYLVPECLFDFLGRLDPDEPLFAGHYVSDPGFLQGGAGYVISRAALDLTRNLTRARCSAAWCARHYKGKYSFSEDRWMGDCMNSTGTRARHSNRFFSMSLARAYMPPRWTWQQQELQHVWDVGDLHPPYVPRHGLVTLHRYKSYAEFVTVHALLRRVRVP